MGATQVIFTGPCEAFLWMIDEVYLVRSQLIILDDYPFVLYVAFDLLFLHHTRQFRWCQFLPATNQSWKNVVWKRQTSIMFPVFHIPGATPVESGQRIELQCECFRVTQPHGLCLFRETGKCCKT